jgi:beta-lactam-binding protein with PASTA domain
METFTGILILIAATAAYILLKKLLSKGLTSVVQLFFKSKREEPQQTVKKPVEPIYSTTTAPNEHVCAQCGESNAEDASFCMECGAPLIPSTIEPEWPQQEEVVPGQALGASIAVDGIESITIHPQRDFSENLCPACNFSNNVEAVFCQECGASLVMPEDGSIDVQPEEMVTGSFIAAIIPSESDIIDSDATAITEEAEASVITEEVVDSIIPTDFIERICATCGLINEEDAIFCQGCGTPIAGVEGTAVVPLSEGAMDVDQHEADLETPILPIESGMVHEEKKTTRKKFLWMGGIAASLILVILLTTGFLNSLSDANSANAPEDKVSVPSVIGMEGELAKETLEGEGLDVLMVEVEDDTKPVGTVLTQSLGANEKVNLGSKIQLEIAIHSLKVAVPDLFGKTTAEASSIVENLGLIVSIKEQIDDNSVPGLVLAQSLAKETKVNPGETIEIVVSVASSKVDVPPVVATTGKVDVPSVVGKTVAQATSLFASAGLSMSQTQQYSDTVQNGVVISQNVASGTKVAQGSTVQIVVSKGKTAWSGWVEILPASVKTSTHYIEEKIQYQYQDKEWTTNSASTLAGWTKFDESFVWGAWSAWSTTAISATATNEVSTRQVANATQYKTVHNYNRWIYLNTSNQWASSYAQYTGSAYQGSGAWNYITLDSPLAAKGSVDGKTHYGSYHYGSYPSATDNLWWNYTTSSVALPVTYHTEYQYRDKVITYRFFRWNAWSAWQDAQVTATSDRQVNSKTLYRYRGK